VHLTHGSVDCWNFGQRHADALRAKLPGVRTVICREAAEFLRALPEAGIAVAWRFRQEWFDLAPRLRILATPAAGRDYFTVTPPAGVEVLYGSFHGTIMAETAVGMLLALARGLARANGPLRECAWPRAALSPGMRTLRGSHVVILGYGAIGRHLARLLEPFGVTVTGVRRRTPGPDAAEDPKGTRVVGVAELDDILPRCDHLVCVLPGGPDTDGLLDERRLSLLPEGAALVNLGRGNCLDHEALVRGLGEGRPAAAFLDVFAEEPLPPNSPLIGCPNLYRLPHASAIAPEYLDLFVEEFAERLAARGYR
jgi:phosphoglycerate dehydrogenase-like enzyme